MVVSCSCGQLFAATIDMIGMEANCPRCGQLIVVPAPQHRPVPTHGTSAPPNLDSLGIDARTPGPFDKTLTAARDISAWERTAATPQPNAARGAHAHTTKSIADSLMGQARQEMSDRNAGVPEPNYGLMIAGAGIALIGFGILVGASIAHSDMGSIIGTCKLFGGIGVFARGYSAKRYDG